MNKYQIFTLIVGITALIVIINTFNTNANESRFLNEHNSHHSSQDHKKSKCQEHRHCHEKGINGSHGSHGDHKKDLQSYQAHLQKHKKQFSQDEISRRHQNFQSNIEKINNHNKHHYKNGTGNESYWQSPNQFSDMSSEEFQKHLGLQHPSRQIAQSRKSQSFDDCQIIQAANSQNCYELCYDQTGEQSSNKQVQCLGSSQNSQPNSQPSSQPNSTPSSKKNSSSQKPSNSQNDWNFNINQPVYPTSFNATDWVELGGVTNVKDQGQCGSCYAFATTGALEGLYFVKNKKLLSFSEQQIVDCSERTNGCIGGYAEIAFRYTQEKGIMEASNYPYAAEKMQCQYQKKDAVFYNKGGAQKLPLSNENAFMDALSRQPLAISIKASDKSFQHYAGGIYTAKCGTVLDHEVLAVAFDDNSVTLKNSWSATWGDNGYIHFPRKGYNKLDGQCGLYLDAFYPIA